MRIGILVLLMFTMLNTLSSQTKTITGDVYLKEILKKTDQVKLTLLSDGRTQDSFYISKAGQSFSFKVDVNKVYMLRAQKEGYLTENIVLDHLDEAGTDKYQITVGHDTTAYRVQGFITDDEGNTLTDTKVWLVNTMTHHIEESKTDASGGYEFWLRPGYDFQIRAKKSGYLKDIAYINYCANKPDKNSLYCLKGFRDVSYSKDDNGELHLETVMDLEKIDLKKTYRIDNIYYDLDQHYIRPDAARELNKLVKVLKDNPEINIELSSHTDCRASATYNQELSQRRAEAAVQYIISKGIDSSRMVAKGYGEEKLTNRCSCEGLKRVPCSEAEHQRNRRTEFRITSFTEWDGSRTGVEKLD
jgi:peptidoglycan-associated lipoprotein